MKGKDTISAVVGGAFFAVPYLASIVTIGPALAIGCAAFGASELVLSSFKPKETLKTKDRNLYYILLNAKKQNKEIINLSNKVEDKQTQKNLKEINETVSKIITTVETNPKKAKGLNNFFDYYLPVLIKIVDRYDEVENQKLASKEGKEFMKKADKMIDDTNNAFKSILSNLYQNDIIDTDADMKVYDMMLKADGIIDNKIEVKGSEKVEE